MAKVDGPTDNSYQNLIMDALQEPTPCVFRSEQEAVYRLADAFVDAILERPVAKVRVAVTYQEPDA